LRALVADAASCQYTPPQAKPGPGRPDAYPVSIDLKTLDIRR
jgi:hypothetical protein